MRPAIMAVIAACGPFAALPTVLREEPRFPARPTYSEHVEPVLRARCVSCHQKEGSAPFSLLGYGQARRWATMTAQVTGSRRMPPWKPTESGVFHDENRLSDEEIAMLRAWEKAGMPKGPEMAASKVCPPTTCDLGVPDVTLRAEKAYVVGGGAADEYRYFVVRNPFQEPRWLQATDLGPGNPHVVHHMTAFLDETGKAFKLARANKDGQPGYPATGGPKFMPTSVIGFWAPGMQTRRAPEGTAFRIAPGASIVVQVHYTSTGKAEADRWHLGLYLAKEPPKLELKAGSVEREKLDIPAGQKSCMISEELKVPRETTLYALMPHMHTLGRRAQAEVIYPNGTKRSLIEIADWDPAWQSLYWFKEPVRLPEGARLRYTVTYDNSKDNPRNSASPPRDVHWGEDAKAEMMLLAFLYTEGKPR